MADATARNREREAMEQVASLAALLDQATGILRELMENLEGNGDAAEH